jgi:hypothetical protein
MTRFSVTLLLTAAAFITPVSAQNLNLNPTPTWVRTFYGCAPNISCHAVTVTWWLDPDGAASGSPFSTIVRIQSWFGMNPWGAGFPHHLSMDGQRWPDDHWTFRNYAEREVDETFFTTGLNWAPQWATMVVEYGGPPGTRSGMMPHWARVPLSVTPEPASMVLLATGLGAVAAAAKRRKRRTETATCETTG